MIDQNMIALAAVGLFALCATILIGLKAAPIGKAWRLFDMPSDRKLHKAPTPLMGGVALLVVSLAAFAAAMFILPREAVSFRTLAVLFGSCWACCLIGLRDDQKPLSATFRLAASVVIYAIALAVDSRFRIVAVHFTGHPFLIVFAPFLSWIFSLTVMVGFLNAVNMADGKNGLVISMCLLWAVVLSLIGPVGLVDILLPIGVMLTTLLWFNMHSRLFLGDGGSYGLATLFGMIAVLSYNVSEGRIGADMMTLLFIVPGLDMIRLFVARIAKRRSPMDADRDHFHHLLYDVFGWPTGLAIYLALMAVPAFAAVLMPAMTPVILAIAVLTYISAVYFIHRRYERPDLLGLREQVPTQGGE